MMPRPPFLLLRGQSETLPVTRAADGVDIQLPGALPDPIASAVVLDIQGAPMIASAPPTAFRTP